MTNRRRILAAVLIAACCTSLQSGAATKSANKQFGED